MSSDLIQRLRRLQHGFSAPCASLADAAALFDVAQAFKRICGTGGLQDPAEVTGSLAALLQQIGTLSRKLLGAAASNPAAMGIQFDAACVTIQGCALLSNWLPLGHSDAFRLASSLELVFGAGMHFLQQDLTQPTNMAGLLVECKHQLAAVGTTLQRAAHPEVQSEAVNSAIAAFARTAGRPQAVLPWLLTVSQALLAVPADCGRSCDECLRSHGIAATGVLASTLQGYIATVISLFGWLHETYGSAAQQAPATQQAVVSVLLDRCLAVLAADCSPETLAAARHAHCVMATFLANAVCVPCLAGELEQRLDQPRGAAYVQQALQVVAALPLQPSAAGQADTFGEQHAGAVALLAHLCSQWVGMAGGSSIDPRWSILEALPRIATMVAGLSANSAIPATRLARICQQLQTPVLFANRLLRTIDNNRQLAAYAAAADASLRLVPSLWQLHERCQVLDEPPVRFAPSLLAHQLVVLLDKADAAAAYCKASQCGTQPLASDEQLVRQLWALHTSLCRLVAWVAADPSGARAALLPGGRAHAGFALVEWLGAVRFVVVTVVARGIENGVLSHDCLHGICAAHWAALQAAVDMAGGVSGCGIVVRHIGADLDSISTHFQGIGEHAPFIAMLTEVVAQLVPFRDENLVLANLAAASAGALPHFAVALARGGTLGSLLAEARRVKRGGNVQGAPGLAGIIQSALRNLDLSADESAALLLDTAAQQQPLLQQVRQAVGVSSGLQCDDDADALAAQLLELSSRLPAATKLADVLHECFQPAMQPEWHVDAQLALAQAAATRSCAYLRCANLGGEGGPATGQGVGSMRCSACRAVRYCGTACSHADWREGGHRRVCNALGAARRAAKEAATVAAAAAAEGQQGS